MSRTFTFAILGALLIVLGAMSYVVERAGKPDAPKASPQQTAEAQKKAMEERMQQEKAQREKMVAAIKAQADAKGGKKPGTPDGKQGDVINGRPVNPTAPPMMSGGKNTLPAGALDISEDWFKKRKPGHEGIKQLETEAATTPPPVSPPPSAAPGMPPR